MFRYFKTVVFILKLISSSVVLRNYGKIIYDISNKYGGVFPISRLRKLEKLSLKVDEANFEIIFFVKLQKIKRNTKVFNFQLTVYQ